MEKEKHLSGFNIPPIPINSISRLRLLEKLDKASRGALTLLTAPAGYGKTTLLSQWVSQCSIPCIWVTLCEKDNSLRGFTARLRSAVGEILEIFPDSGVIADHRPFMLKISEDTAWLLDLLSSLPMDCALVLDDYHIISAPQVHKALAYLIRHMPPRLHLLIASRTIPPFDRSYLRVNGQLSEITTNSLRLSRGEIEELFNKAGIEVTEDLMTILNMRTEGWAAAVQLVLLRLQDMPKEKIFGFLSTFTARDTYLWDYLSEEILYQQPPSIRQFMVETSFLHKLNRKLCDEVLGKTDSRACLDYLERSNLVLPLDQQRQWFHYPHLLSDYLSKVLECELGIEKIIKLHAKASYWYERQGDFNAAANHAFGARDADRAWRLFDRGAERIVPFDHLTWRLGFMEFSNEVLLSQPELCLFAAFSSVVTGEFAMAERPLRLAEQTFKHLGNYTGLGRVYAVRAFISRNLGMSQDAITQAKKALDYQPDDSKEDRSEILLTLGLAYSDIGCATIAEQLVNQARQAIINGKDNYLAQKITWSLARIAAMRGKLRESEELYKEVIGFSDFRIDNQASASYIFLGRLYYEQNKLDLTEEYLIKGIDELQCMNVGHYIPLGYATLAQLLSRERKESQARVALGKAASYAENGKNKDCSRFIKALAARLALQHKDIASARLWLSAASPMPIDDGSSFGWQYEHLTLVRLLLAESRASGCPDHYDEAQRMLMILLPHAENEGRISDVIEMRVLLALSLYERRYQDQALDALEPGLAIAELEGFVRTFIDEGKPMGRLLSWASSNNLHKSYVEHLLDELNFAPQPASPNLRQLVATDPLTEREIEVLRLIAQGISTSEIAESLTLSIHTVRTHIKTIISKLEVHSRMQAVERARIMGLL